MKFFLSILVYLFIAFLMGWGIYMIMQPDGKPWLLIGSVLGYLLIAAKKGCLDTH